MPSAAQVGAMPSRRPTSVTVAMRSARLTGKNAADPLGSVAQRAALVKAGQRLPQCRGEGPEGHNPEGVPPLHPLLSSAAVRGSTREEPAAVAPMPDMGTEGLDGQSRSRVAPECVREE